MYYYAYEYLRSDSILDQIYPRSNLKSEKKNFKENHNYSY